jgi:hypothetical protein
MGLFNERKTENLKRRRERWQATARGTQQALDYGTPTHRIALPLTTNRQALHCGSK